MHRGVYECESSRKEKHSGEEQSAQKNVCRLKLRVKERVRESESERERERERERRQKL